MDGQERAEVRAVQTRVHVDDLADQVGEGRKVLTDDIGPCEPGDDEGLDLVYSLRVQVESVGVASVSGSGGCVR